MATRYRSPMSMIVASSPIAGPTTTRGSDDAYRSSRSFSNSAGSLPIGMEVMETGMPTRDQGACAASRASLTLGTSIVEALDASIVEALPETPHFRSCCDGINHSYGRPGGQSGRSRFGRQMTAGRLAPPAIAFTAEASP